MPDRESLSAQIGESANRVKLEINGDAFKLATRYKVRASIFQQPASFELTTGHAGIAKDILERYPIGSDFRLRIGPNIVMSGRIDAASPSGQSTEVTFTGRDHMAPLVDGYVEEDRSFSEISYYDLTRKVLDLAGLKERAERPRFTLQRDGDNVENLKAVTGTKVVRVAPPRPPPTGTTEVEQQDAQGGNKRVVYNTIKAQLGTTWYQFLQDQYRLAGVFLWCQGNGDFVIGSPDANKKPAYRIERVRGNTREFTNVVDARWRNDWTNRHSKAIVYGRGGGGKFGRTKIRGEFVDEELTNAKGPDGEPFAIPIQKAIVEHNQQAKTAKHCEFLARRRIAQERRDGWQLTYTLSGHTMPALQGGGYAVWAPDMVCQVYDEELGIDGQFYVAEVLFSRGPETTTEVTLMRPEDLVFAEKLFPNA